MFADQVRIFVAGGSGGDGSTSFRREAHVPRGGPDGGDGGSGGDVVLVVDAGMTTLGDLRQHRHHRARPGGHGAGRKAHGKNAADVVLRVPPGTVVRLAPEGDSASNPDEATLIGELMTPDERLVVARGGRGGRGNVHFVSATHQVPRHAQKGEPGESRWIELELKLIADIGLVGAPNAGKSTLLAALTAATPEIGDYAFTTLSPNLGVIELGDERRAVIADLPGLIEGANEGRGLGHAFLRHAERTRVLVAVVNGAAADPVGEWRAVANELAEHDSSLMQRPMPMVVTKQDLPEVHARWPALRSALRADGAQPIPVSAQAGTGLRQLRAALDAALAEAERTAVEPSPGAVRLHRFDPLDAGWQVIAEADGLRVRGRRIETTASRTDFANEESRDRFQRTLERLGIDAELRRQGATGGTLVRIGPIELEWGDEG
jgi:GTP-binding protein